MYARLLFNEAEYQEKVQKHHINRNLRHKIDDTGSLF